MSVLSTAWALLVRLSDALNRSAIDRYVMLQKKLDYLPRRAVWWGGLVATVVLFSIIGNALSGGFIGMTLVFIRLMANGPTFQKHGPAPFTVAVWEVVLWEHILWVGGGVFGAITQPPLNVDFLVEHIVSAVVWTTILYLYIDLFDPPRDRKRVKLPERSKVPIPEFVT